MRIFFRLTRKFKTEESGKEARISPASRKESYVLLCSSQPRVANLSPKLAHAHVRKGLIASRGILLGFFHRLRLTIFTYWYTALTRLSNCNTMEWLVLFQKCILLREGFNLLNTGLKGVITKSCYLSSKAEVLVLSKAAVDEILYTCDDWPE